MGLVVRSPRRLGMAYRILSYQRMLDAPGYTSSLATHSAVGLVASYVASQEEVLGQAPSEVRCKPTWAAVT